MSTQRIKPTFFAAAHGSVFQWSRNTGTTLKIGDVLSE
jgi:hypothetical protein